MNQAEKDQIKTYMRKLARIAQELNELAFQMADFEGREYKQTEESPELDPVIIDTPWEATKDLKEDARVAEWRSKYLQLTTEIQRETNREKASALKRTRGTIAGHIARATGERVGETVWKSQVK